MPLKIIHQNHSEIIGRGMVILSSPPVAGLPQELQSGQLVEEAALLSKSHAIIARPTKAGIDPAIFHSVNSDFEQGIRRLLDDNDIKCILQVSCKEHQGLEVETTNLGPMPSETLQQVIARFAPNFDVKTVSTPNVKGSIVVAKDLPSAGSKLNEV